MRSYHWSRSDIFLFCLPYSSQNAQLHKNDFQSAASCMPCLVNICYSCVRWQCFKARVAKHVSGCADSFSWHDNTKCWWLSHCGRVFFPFKPSTPYTDKNVKLCVHMQSCVCKWRKAVKRRAGTWPCTWWRLGAVFFTVVFPDSTKWECVSVLVRKIHTRSLAVLELGHMPVAC